MAGVSEVFNLDFKFGGNAEFLSRLEKLMERVDARFESTTDDISDAADATKEMADAVDDLNSSFKSGMSSLSQFGEKLKDIAGYYLSFQAAKAGAERIWSFGMQSMDAYSTQERAENQLKGVMKNRGTLDQFQTIKDYAANIQGRSIYGDEAMIKGAGELATYVKGTESLKGMMDLLTDYAAGMTGGGEVSPEQMESLATGLGMAYDGNYMAMRRKGFDTSKLEALDALQESGGVWNAKMQKKYGADWDKEQIADFQKIVKEAKKLGGISEQMRVDALKESLGDWQGLSDAVNGLDSSALIRFNNKLGDIRENIGKKIYPTFNKLVETLDSHMPDIEDALNSVGEMFETIATAIEDNFDTIKDAVKMFAGFIEVVSKFPRVSIAAAVSLKALSSGALLAKDGFASLSVQASKSTKEILKMNGALGALVGSAGGGLASGLMADVGSDKGDTDNALGALGAVASGAAMGAAQFGAMGAAIGAVATGVGLLVKAFMELKEVAGSVSGAFGLIFGGDTKFEKDSKEKDAAFEKMMNARSKWKMDQRYGSGKSDASYKAYREAVRDYQEWSGDALPEYIKKEIVGDRQQEARNEAAAKAAQKGAKVDMSTTYNTTNIEQNVSLATDIQKVGILLNQNIRAIIESQMRTNREVGLATR